MANVYIHHTECPCTSWSELIPSEEEWVPGNKRDSRQVYVPDEVYQWWTDVIKAHKAVMDQVTEYYHHG